MSEKTKAEIIEWDMDNGEVLNRIPFKTVEEAEEALEEIIREAEEEGWICEEEPNGGYICSKDDISRLVYIEEK